MECLIPRKNTLKILCKSKHFPGRYKRKHEWVFFSEHSVLRYNASTMNISSIVQQQFTKVLFWWPDLFWIMTMSVIFTQFSRIHTFIYCIYITTSSPNINQSSLASIQQERRKKSCEQSPRSTVILHDRKKSTKMPMSIRLHCHTTLNKNCQDGQ